MPGRPLVIICGWLGSQQKHLRKIESLYETLGFDVISVIPEPRLVVDSALNHHRTEVPKEGPTRDLLHQSRPAKMQHLAWKILLQAYRKQCLFLFHGFSNGGCFLWEAMRKLMEFHKNVNCPQPTRDILKALSCRTRGVIFDSGPCWFGEDSLASFATALQHCSPREKMSILKEYGPGVVLYDGDIEVRRQNMRCREFFGFLQEDDLDIPQLYLFSKDDPLCDFRRVMALIKVRRSMQKSKVCFKVWDESAHCSHLRTEPLLYKQAIEMFMRTALLKSKL